MANDVMHAIVDDPVGNCDGLLGITCVVVDHTFELCAIHATTFIDLLDCHLAAHEDHVTILGDRAGNRANEGDFDWLCGVGVTSGEIE
ncbi:hypothetical protein D3C75_929950 [compost metagenome]